MSSLPRIIRAAVAGKRWLELFMIIVKSSPHHFLIRSDLGNLTMIRVSAGLHPISAISCLSETQKIRNWRMLTEITLMVMKLSPESKIVMSAHHVINISPTMTSSSTFNMSKIFIFFVKLTSCISDSCDRDGRSSFSPQPYVASLACSENQHISSNNQLF